MSHVVLEKLTKYYGNNSSSEARAVDGINLSIAEGEFMVFVGPSGCGKSTTLRMIAGLEEISEGRISIGGRVVNTVAPKDRDIAMVFQNYALYPHMTVYANMAFGLKLKKLDQAIIESRVRKAAESLGLTPYLDRLPKALSGGQRQRVALGRALVRQPKVFLFDEPLSNLDAKMRVTMRTEIARLHAQLKATMIYVTHDQAEAMTLGDRICVMQSGRIMQVDSPMEIYRRPANLFVASFIGSPGMNFFRGKLHEASKELYFVEEGGPQAKAITLRLPPSFAADGKMEGKSVILGVRPENIHLLPPGAVEDTHSRNITVELIEPMGAETYLHFRTAGSPVIARTSLPVQIRPGEDIRVTFDLKQACFFDAVTENALPLPGHHLKHNG